MLKYRRKLSQGRGWVHDYNTILYNFEVGITSLVLYILQSGTAWDRVQYGCLLCNRIHSFPLDILGEVGDEVNPVSFVVGRQIRLYQEIDGVDEGYVAEFL